MKPVYIFALLILAVQLQLKAGTYADNPSWQKGNAKPKNIVYKINGTVVPDLTNRVPAGSIVTVSFKVDKNTSPTTISLASYTAPSSSFNANTANQQELFDWQTVTTKGGQQYTLTVNVPNCFFQVDFVYGPPIRKLGPNGSNNFYSAQNRLIEYSGGGGKSCHNVSSCIQGNATAKNIKYYVNGILSPLNKVKSGDELEVVFNTDDYTRATRFSLVSYQAPDSKFDEKTADQQKVYDSVTALFGPGSHSMKITVPDCYFQLDFVYGCVISQLGPAKSNNFYGKQNRLISHANGGTGACIADSIPEDLPCDTCDTAPPFPVKLIDFSAKKIEQNAVQLDWTTAMEINNDYMAIEKSSDVNTWEEVCRVAGAPGGYSNSPRHYSCVDRRANSTGQNNVYYRPKQVDFNGTYEYFNMIRIRLEDVNSLTSIDQVYPNPATDRIHIAYNTTENGMFNISLMGLDGRILLSKQFVSQTGNQLVDLDLPETKLESGFYILEVKSEDQVFRQKVYKQ